MKKINYLFLFLILLSFNLKGISQELWPKGKTALLIIDIQEFYFPGGFSELSEPEPAAANAALLLDHFRKNGQLVIHIGHVSGKQQEFREEVKPIEDEFVIMKEKVNAFASGELHVFLKEEGITNLVICGMQTHMCVEAATRAASDLGYQVTLVRDACATKDLDYHGTMITAEQVHASTLKTLDRNYARVVDTPSFIAETGWE